MARGRKPRERSRRTTPSHRSVPDVMEDASYAIEDYSPWYGLVERDRSLRSGAWLIRYWRAGWRFRWRMLRSLLAFGAAATLVYLVLDRV